MAATPRGKQINFEVSDPRLMLALQQIALVRDVTLPDLMRELVRNYVEEELSADANLRAAVEAAARARATRAPAEATVTALPKARTKDSP